MKSMFSMKISVQLRDTLRAGYQQLRANSPAVRRSGGDIEVEARLHNMRLSALDALDEAARRGYGRVALLEEINNAGEVVGQRLCRVSQANASLPEAAIVPRNSPIGSEIASCQVGDELEIKLPPGKRCFVVSALIDLEGAVQLLRPRPEIRLARFRIADDPEEDVIREVRAFLENLLITAEAPAAPPVPEVPEVKPTTFELRLAAGLVEGAPRARTRSGPQLKILHPDHQAARECNSSCTRRHGRQRNCRYRQDIDRTRPPKVLCQLPVWRTSA
jgi:transcription elongation GreA/GreB family factor